MAHSSSHVTHRNEKKFLQLFIKLTLSWQTVQNYLWENPAVIPIEELEKCSIERGVCSAASQRCWWLRRRSSRSLGSCSCRFCWHLISLDTVSTACQPWPCELETINSILYSTVKHASQQHAIVMGLFSFFLSFLFQGGTCSLRMPALRPASQAGPMRNLREGTSVVLCDIIIYHIRFWYLWCCGCPGLRGRQHLATPHTRSP